MPKPTGDARTAGRHAGGRRAARARTPGLTAALAGAAALTLSAAAPAAAAPARPAGPALAPFSGSAQSAVHRASITIDGARPGPAFQGVGAISGGGGNSRLLIDYPEPQRSQILDYLFKPGYGAALQVLKLEIGGDAYATDGSEPSIQHAKGQSPNCNAGYEFWLAEQARKLNPGIQIYALQWNAPAWIGGGGQNAWTTADIQYILRWLHCASSHKLRVNYLGGWNEHLPHGITAHVMSWFEKLRATLNAHGYRRVKIVAVDSFAHVSSGTDVADYLARHPAFRRAVTVLGYHNLCRYPASGKVCFIPAAARKLSKPVWESEIGALRQGTGVPAMARSLNNAFIQVGATGLIVWPLIGSIPGDLPLEDRGLITAEQPWSGQYHVNQMTWILAQTSRFTRPGWVHIKGASHQLGGSYGSYTSYEPRNHSAWTMVAQTSDAPGPQTITVHVKAGLPRSVVHVWSTSIYSSRAKDWLVHNADVHPRGGAFTYRLRRGFVYTFTTLRDPGKAMGHQPASPTSTSMPETYTARPDASNEPWGLAPQDGAFEYVKGSSTVFEQTAAGRPVFWQNPVSTRFPYAVVGGSTWKNYQVSASVSFTAASQDAGLIARFDHPKADGVAERFYGYQFIVSASGAWRLVRDVVGAGPATLKSGKLAPAPGTGAWTQLSLSVNGSALVGAVNGTAVVKVSDTSYASGIAGVSTGGWYRVQFRDLKVCAVTRPLGC